MTRSNSLLKCVTPKPSTSKTIGITIFCVVFIKIVFELPKLEFHSRALLNKNANFLNIVLTKPTTGGPGLGGTKLSSPALDGCPRSRL